ncbi:MAG: helix-turn-helix domain-containing protein [Pirellulales bacterium]|nr:helix-turn-helix domain-containing protein [Pirellulales bacterium]
MRLSIYQVAERCQVAVSTVYSWRDKNWIPAPTRLGGRVFWSSEVLDQWEAEGYPRPCDQQEQEQCQPH